MWIMLNDAFFSIVAKDCSREELMVRARRPGDIEKVFPSAKGRVTEFTASDYHYRCAISKDEIKRALCGEIDRVTYTNFKDSVGDTRLHNAYHRVWSAMASLQPKAPYSGKPFFFKGQRGLSIEEEAHVLATGHMPDDDFFAQFDNIPSTEPTVAKKNRRTVKKNTRGR